MWTIVLVSVSGISKANESVFSDLLVSKTVLVLTYKIIAISLITEMG